MHTYHKLKVLDYIVFYSILIATADEIAGSKSDVIAMINRFYSITQDDLLCLINNKWLNDRVCCRDTVFQYLNLYFN